MSERRQYQMGLTSFESGATAGLTEAGLVFLSTTQEVISPRRPPSR